MLSKYADDVTHPTEAADQLELGLAEAAAQHWDRGPGTRRRSRGASAHEGVAGFTNQRIEHGRRLARGRRVTADDMADMFFANEVGACGVIAGDDSAGIARVPCVSFVLPA
jgi:hypothetical protein